MKLLLYSLVLLYSLSLVNFTHAVSLFSGTSATRNSNSSISNKVAKKNATDPRWLTYNPTLMNMSETYSFDTTGEYFSDGIVHTAGHPDYRQITPRYAFSRASITNAIYVNQSCFLPFAYDSTGVRQNFSPAANLMTMSDIISNGKAYFGVDFSYQLPKNCEIYNDDRTLDDVSGYFQITNLKPSPRIGTGMLLYRSSTNGDFSGWDDYVSLDKFASSDLRIQFNENRYCQVVILYEVHNYDDGWWMFQQHQYYHMLGVYNFRTSSNY